MANELRFKNGDLLFVDGDLAMSEGCCCDDLEPLMLTLLNLPDNGAGILTNVSGVRGSPATDPFGRFLCNSAGGPPGPLTPYWAYSSRDYSPANGSYAYGSAIGSLPFSFNQDGGISYKNYGGPNWETVTTVTGFTYLSLLITGSYSGPGNATFEVRYYRKSTSAAYDPSTNHAGVIAHWQRTVAIPAGDTLPTLGSVTLDINHYSTSRSGVTLHEAAQWFDQPCVDPTAPPDYYPQAIITF